MRIHTVFSISLSMIVVGCAIRPLPKNVTRDTTFSIVEKIRCEARDALIEVIKGELRKTKERSPHEVKINRDLLKVIAAGDAGPKFFCDLNPGDIAGKSLDKFKDFSTDTITYVFKFDVTENKIKSGGLDFSLPFTRGTFGLKLAASSDKKRQNVRTLTISDTFAGLVIGRNAQGKKLQCKYNQNQRVKPRKHWVYPITGNIGLEEVVKTYVDLRNTESLKDSLKDKLTFTTNLKMSADPKVTLSALPSKKFRISEASFGYTANRIDKHEVDITLNQLTTKPAVKEEYTRFAGAERIIGMPDGFELGFLVKSNKKKASIKKKSEKCAVFAQIMDSSGNIKMVGNPFSLSKEVEDAAIRAGVAESRRLDALDTSRSLRDLIGK